MFTLPFKDIKLLTKTQVLLHEVIPEIPPFRVVALCRCAAIEHTPPPEVNEVTKGKESYLLQCHLQQVVKISFWKGKKNIIFYIYIDI